MALMSRVLDKPVAFGSGLSKLLGQAGLEDPGWLVMVLLRQVSIGMIAISGIAAEAAYHGVKH
jgi:hypothetical protein